MSKTSKFKRLKAVIGAIVLTGVMMTSTVASTVNAVWTDSNSGSYSESLDSTFTVRAADISTTASDLASVTLSGYDDVDCISYASSTVCNGSYIDREVFEAGDVTVSIGFDYKIDVTHKIITISDVYGVVTNANSIASGEPIYDCQLLLNIPKAISTEKINKVIGDFFDTSQFGKKEFVIKNEVVSTTYGYQTYVTSAAQSVLKNNSLTIKKVVMNDDMKTNINKAGYTIINIPATVEDFRPYLFNNVTNKVRLENINYVQVSKDNTVYSASGGVLYNKDESELLWIPPQIHVAAYYEYLIHGGYRFSAGDIELVSTISPSGKKSIDLHISSEKVNENAFVDFDSNVNKVNIPSLDCREVKDILYTAQECVSIDSIILDSDTSLAEVKTALEKSADAPDAILMEKNCDNGEAELNALNDTLHGIIYYSIYDTCVYIDPERSDFVITELPTTEEECKILEEFEVSKSDELLVALSKATGIRKDLLKVKIRNRALIDDLFFTIDDTISEFDFKASLSFIDSLKEAVASGTPSTLYIPKTFKKFYGMYLSEISCFIENRSEHFYVTQDNNRTYLRTTDGSCVLDVITPTTLKEPAVTTTVTTTTKTTTTKTTTTTVTSNKNPAITDPEGYVRTRYDIDLTDYADGLEITHNGFIYKPSEFNYEKLEKDGEITYNILWCWVDCVGTTLNNTNMSEIHLPSSFDTEDEAYKKKLNEAIKKAIGSKLSSNLATSIDEEMESKLHLFVTNTSYACLHDFLNDCENIRIYAYDTAVSAITPLPKAEIIDPSDTGVHRIHYSGAPSKVSDGIVGNSNSNVCVFDCVNHYGHANDAVLCSETTGNATNFIFSDKVKGATVTNLSNILKVADSLTFYNKDTVLSSADFLNNDVTWDDKSFGLSEIPEHKDTLVIRGYSGSTAEKFAKEIGADFEVIDSSKTREAKHFLSKTTTGDLNNDNDGGSIADISMLSKYLVSDITYPLSMQGIVNADINNDGGVDALDSNYMIEAALGRVKLPE